MYAILLRDMSLNWLSTGLSHVGVTRSKSTTLKDWYRIIDWNFEHYGPRVSTPKPEPLFTRFARDEHSLTTTELKTLQDHLFHYCVQYSIDYHLPIKLHCGYLAANNMMPLARLSRIASNLCPLLAAYPDARFVLMHLGYPYQDEFIALGKHYSNVYLDMCWAWLVNPQASFRFLKEALMAVPSCKLFSFGGDYYPVEPVVGHAHIARQGITQALSELVLEGWLSKQLALDIAHQIMRANAQRVFDYERVHRAWQQ